MCRFDATHAAKPPLLKQGPFVGDDPQPGDLTGRRVGEILDPGDTEEDLDLGQRGLGERDRVLRCLRDRDRAREVDLRPVVDDPTEVPCAVAEGLELAEVGLPQPVPSCRRHDEGSRRTPASWRTSLV